MSKPILSAKNYSLYFNTREGKVNAVNGIDFEINSNEIIALVGESGSGKTVFSKSLMGLLPKTAKIKNGEIEYINKKNEKIYINNLKEEEFYKIRGKEISMIFQDPMTSLNPVIKIGKQIEETILANSEYKINKKEAKFKTYEILDLIGIDNPKERYNNYSYEFSGGMRQRVVIAIALSCNPKILIADEPTTALDVTVQAQILDLIKKLQLKRKFSVIFITHDLGIVANIADKVNVMYAGEIIEKGLVEEIFYNPKHPYTWGLLSSIPDINDKSKKLFSIPGFPPNMLNNKFNGDPFAPRNKWALNIDWVKKPPFFKITDTHYAKTWLLDKRAPHINFK